MAELAIMLWLLIVGAKEHPLAADVGASLPKQIPG
jgi:hypothetical protein